MKKICRFFALLCAIFVSAAAFAQSDSYKLSPLDVIKLDVFQEQDLSTTTKISASGTVSLPLIGEVKIAGLTILDATTKIKDLYAADYLVNPQINLFILDYAPKRVSVFGQVYRQGEVRFPPEEGITLTKAIGDAGGFTGKANRYSVIVKRIMPDGTQKTFDVNVKDILDNKTARDMPLENGDIVQVQESIF